MPWLEIATQVGIPIEHEASTDDLQAMFNVAIGALAVDEQREFDQWQGAMVPQDKAPVETIASLVLMLQWHAISVPSTALFPASRQEEVSDVESVGTVSESNQAFLERSLLAAVATRTPVSPGLVRQGHSKMRHSRVGKSAAVPLTHSRPRPFCALAGNSNTGRHPC